MMDSGVPRKLHRLVAITAVFIVVGVLLAGFNAYMAFASPLRQSTSVYVPSTVTFQGALTDALGVPVADGNYSFVFSLYDAATGGTQVWTESHANVPVSGGLYSVQLGSQGSPLQSSHFTGDRYLQVTVEGDTLTNRIPITAVPFALNAGQAMGLQGNDVSSDEPADGALLVWNATSSEWVPEYPVVDTNIVQGRLTLESGNPIPATDLTAKTTLYFTPYNGNRIALYNGTEWALYAFSEISMSVPSTTANTNYDIFVHDNTGTLTLEAVAWANNTERATALAQQDRVYVKSGAATHRYLGTIRTTDTIGQCEDSQARRFVWNMYNREPRLLYGTISASSWSRTNSTGASNSNTTDGQGRLSFVLGTTEALVTVLSRWQVAGSGANPNRAAFGLGLDSTSILDSLARGIPSSTAEIILVPVEYKDYPGIGYHYLQMIESVSNTCTLTVYGYDSWGFGSKTYMRGFIEG